MTSSRKQRSLTVTEREWLRDRNAVVQAWWRHEKTWWSWNGLSSLCQLEPDEAWHLILLLLEQAPSDADVVSVGLNPLTELLIEHGALFIDRIEAEAGVNPRLRSSLTHVYQNDDAPDIPADVWSRIERIRHGGA